MSQTLLDVLERWDKVAQRSRRTKANYVWGIGRLARGGIVRPEDATAPNLARYIESRMEEASVQTVYGELAALTSVVRYLVTCGEAPREQLHALHDLRPRMRRPRCFHARFLTREEFDRLRYAATLQHREGETAELTIVLATLSGLRAGELMRLHWDDVDLERRTLSVHDVPGLADLGACKTGPRIVPVCEELRTFLEPRRGRGYVFATGSRASVNVVSTNRILWMRIVRAAARAKLDKVTLHVLRHTRASWWIQAGVPLAKVAFWMGHSPEICARFYGGLLVGYDEECEKTPPPPRKPAHVGTGG